MMFRVFTALIGIVLLSFTVCAQKDSVTVQNLRGFNKILDVDKLHAISLDTLKSNPELAKRYAQKAISIASAKTDTVEIVESLLIASRIERTQGDYETAMAFDIRALRMAEQLSDNALIADALNTIGINQYRLNDFDAAMQNFRKSLTIRTQLGDSAGVADVWSNIGMVQDDSGEPENALASYERALGLFNALKYQTAQADVYNNIAGVYYRIGQKDSVVYYAQKSMDIHQQLKDFNSLAYGYINLGVFYFFNGKTTLAIQEINKGLDIARSNQLLSQMRQAYSSLSDIYAEIGEFEKAYEMHKAFAEVNDSVFNTEKQRSIEELKLQYESDKQNQSIEILSQENKIQNLSIQRNRSLWIFFSAISALLLALFVLLLSRHRERLRLNRALANKNQQLSELNATKDKFFAIISHDLKNPLSAFRSISSALDENLETLSSDELKYFSNQLTKSADSLLEMLKNLLDWALTQTGRLKPKPESIQFAAMCTSVINALKPHADTKQVRLDCSFHQSHDMYADKRMIETVLRNLTTNAIKFSPENSGILIHAWDEGNSVCFSVKDEGAGISADDQKKLFRIDEDVRKIGNSEQKGSGLGLILCYEMITLNNGKIRIVSEPDNGSEFIVELPKAN
jgi:signal transduction histidine kinase